MPNTISASIIPDELPQAADAYLKKRRRLPHRSTPELERLAQLAFDFTNHRMQVSGALLVCFDAPGATLQGIAGEDNTVFFNTSAFELWEIHRLEDAGARNTRGLIGFFVGVFAHELHHIRETGPGYPSAPSMKVVVVRELEADECAIRTLLELGFSESEIEPLVLRFVRRGSDRPNEDYPEHGPRVEVMLDTLDTARI